MRWKKLTRVMKAVAIGALAAEATYLVVTNAIIFSGIIQREASAMPDIVTMSWDRAYSLWPGRASVYGFRLRVQDPVIQFQLTVTEATIDVALGDLLDRRFHAKRVWANGVTFRFLPKVAANDRHSRRLTAFPPISGFSRPAVLDDPLPLLTPEQVEALWSVQLDEVSARASELWFLEYRYVGPAEVQGGFALTPLRHLWIGPARLSLKGGTLTAGDSMLSRGLISEFQLTLPPVDLPSVPGLLVFRDLAASLRFETTIDDLSVAQLYVDGLKLGGSAKLAAAIEIADGQLLPGTRMSADIANAALQFDGTHFSGSAEARLSIAENRTSPVIRATASGELKLQIAKSPVTAELSNVKAELIFTDNALSHVPVVRQLSAVLGEARIQKTGALTQQLGAMVAVVAPIVLGDGPLVASATAFVTPEYTLVRLTRLRLGDAEFSGAAVAGANGWNGAAAGHVGIISVGVRLQDDRVESHLFTPAPWLEGELIKAGIVPDA